jgi:hypothetical protein
MRNFGFQYVPLTSSLRAAIITFKLAVREILTQLKQRASFFEATIITFKL